MKKILLSLMTLMSLLVGFTACNDEQALPPMVLPEGGLGTGAWDSPLSALQVNQGSSGTNVWMRGYIVGWIDTNISNAFNEETAKFETPATVNTNLIVALNPDETDPAKCVPVQLPAGDIRNALNLVSNPDNLGKEICLKGNCERYFSTNGFKSPTAFVWGDKGIEEKTVEPKGNGTKEDPFNIQAAYNKCIEIGETQSKDSYYIAGYVVSGQINLSYGNGTWMLCDEPDGSTSQITAYAINDLGNKKFTAADGVKVGDYVVVCAPLLNYKGNTPEANRGYLYSINGKTAEEEVDTPTTPDTPDTPVTPDTPDTPSGDAVAAGAGTLASPYNASQAIQVATANGETSTTEVYVEGYVTEVKEISTQYGNATFYIADTPGGTPTFYVFRLKGFNGDSIADANIIKVGDRVVIKAALINYKGNTPETSQGGSLVSVNGKQG